MSPSFFSGNITNMIPEGSLNKMVPLTEDHGGGGGGARGPPLAHGLLLLAIIYPPFQYFKNEIKERKKES